MSSINSKLSNAELATATPNPNSNPIFPSSIFVPSSRHSIDLGAQSAAAANQLLSARTIHVPYPNTNGSGAVIAGLMNSNQSRAMNSPR